MWYVPRISIGSNFGFYGSSNCPTIDHNMFPTFQMDQNMGSTGTQITLRLLLACSPQIMNVLPKIIVFFQVKTHKRYTTFCFSKWSCNIWGKTFYKLERIIKSLCKREIEEMKDKISNYWRITRFYTVRILWKCTNFDTMGKKCQHPVTDWERGKTTKRIFQIICLET